MVGVPILSLEETYLVYTGLALHGRTGGGGDGDGRCAICDWDCDCDGRGGVAMPVVLVVAGEGLESPRRGLRGLKAGI